MRHQLALAMKRIFYGRRGEPYSFASQRLRFVPGTRPIRLRYANSNNWVNRYDALQIRWLESHLGCGDVAIDIGASSGTVTVLMAALCGQSGHVTAFEPSKASRDIIAKNFALNFSLRPPKIERLACSNYEGEGVFHSVFDGDSTATLAPSDKDTMRTPVPVTTLDAYLSRTHLHPSCIKIDVEGAEIRILKGAQRLLSGRARIICELHPYAWPAFGNTFEEMVALVKEHGRELRYLGEKTIASTPHYGIVELLRMGRS
jgi:FkbM family methyltransferase